jgi:hypothetical protein
MNTLNKKISILAVLILAFHCMMAQTAGSQAAAFITKNMADRLQLDSVQQSKLQTGNESYIGGLIDVFNSDDDRKAKGSRMKELKNDREAAIKKILTREQWKQNEAYQDEQRIKISEVVAGKISENLTPIMQDRLKLTNEQAMQVDSINTGSFKDVLIDLLDDDKGKLKKMMALKKDIKKRNRSMKDVLTGEQYKEYEKMNDEFRKKLKEKMKENKKKN